MRRNSDPRSLNSTSRLLREKERIIFTLIRGTTHNKLLFWNIPSLEYAVANLENERVTFPGITIVQPLEIEICNAHRFATFLDDRHFWPQVKANILPSSGVWKWVGFAFFLFSSDSDLPARWFRWRCDQAVIYIGLMLERSGEVDQATVSKFLSQQIRCLRIDSQLAGSGLSCFCVRGRRAVTNDRR